MIKKNKFKKIKILKILNYLKEKIILRGRKTLSREVLNGMRFLLRTSSWSTE
jgi:hypothetical protein